MASRNFFNRKRHIFPPPLDNCRLKTESVPLILSSASLIGLGNFDLRLSLAGSAVFEATKTYKHNNITL